MASFDNIDHDALMVRLRRRIGDAKVNRLLRAFLKAGVLAEAQFLRAESGVPQGGILSPVLSNIALGVIEERYERHVWPRHTPTRLVEPAAITQRANRARQTDRARGRVVVFPIRYADDFILLVSAPPDPGQDDRARTVAFDEKRALAAYLKERLNLELSETKTLVTPVTRPMAFLGHQVRVRRHPVHGWMVSTAVIPRERSQRFRERIKDLFRRRTKGMSLEAQLRRLNPILRGWASFYRHAWGAKRVLSSLDHYVWWTIKRWLRKKHHRVAERRLTAQYGCDKAGDLHGGRVTLFKMSRVPVGQFKLGWLKPPDSTRKPPPPAADSPRLCRPVVHLRTCESAGAGRQVRKESRAPSPRLVLGSTDARWSRAAGISCSWAPSGGLHQAARSAGGS